MDGNTINNLFRDGILSASQIRKINIINSLRAGVKPGIIASRFKISKQYVYSIRRDLLTKD